jgi:hypothetical protein
MATKTLGTAATNTLTAVSFSSGTNLSDADIATICNAIKDDINAVHPIAPGSFSRMGLLYVPNRGVLKVLPGDYVGYDSATGWPVLVSARAAAGAGWSHS